MEIPRISARSRIPDWSSFSSSLTRGQMRLVPPAQSTESFRTYRTADTFELSISGSFEQRLPFVSDDYSVIYGVYGYAVLRAQTGRATLDFGGHAEVIYLGTIAATSGRVVSQPIPMVRPNSGALPLWRPISTNCSLLASKQILRLRCSSIPAPLRKQKPSH
ncbi:MAG UNVERIFIED_CONTAM: hypothetical protein LVR18_39915 [Planctomycetaceae bacterium]